ncbi:MAG: TetR/AcrR family transcriptional regulator [Sandaracinaceae bacterium]
MGATSAAVRRAREKAERREAILDAAARVFGERGAAAATMEEVAEAAEVSKGTLYLYFQSKDDLSVALTHRPLDAVLERFAALRADEGLDGEALLRRVIETHAEVVMEHAAHFRLAMASLWSQGEPEASGSGYVDRIRTLRDTYVAALERGRTDGSLRPDLDPDEVSLALWASFFGSNAIRMNADRFLARMPQDRPKPDFDRVLPTLIDLLLRALRNPERMPERDE